MPLSGAVYQFRGSFAAASLLDCPTGMADLEIKPTPGMVLRIATLAGAATVISLVLMYLLVGGGRDFFARRTTLITYMPDAAGIMPGSEVRLSGIRIGKVERVELSGLLDPRRAVRAEMRVLTRYLTGIPEDSQTDVNADTLVGDQFIDIAEGKSPIPIRENGVLQSEPAKGDVDQANLIQTLQNNLAQVNLILTNMSSPDSKIGQFILGEDMYDSALTRIKGFDGALHRFLIPRSGIGRAFYSTEMYTRMRNSALQADKLLGSIQNGEGTAGHLFASDEQYDRFLSDLRSLRTSLAEAKAGKGRLGQWLQNDDGYREITRLLARTDAAIIALNEGEGKTGRLLATAQLYESLNGSLQSMEQILRDFREHPRKYLRYKP